MRACIHSGPADQLTNSQLKANTTQLNTAARWQEAGTGGGVGRATAVASVLRSARMALAAEEALMVVRSHYRVCKDMCAPPTPKETAASRRRDEMSSEVRVVRGIRVHWSCSVSKTSYMSSEGTRPPSVEVFDCIRRSLIPLTLARRPFLADLGYLSPGLSRILL